MALKLKKVDYVMLYVSDMAKSLSFYRERLGLEAEAQLELQIAADLVVRLGRVRGGEKRIVRALDVPLEVPTLHMPRSQIDPVAAPARDLVFGADEDDLAHR